MNQQQIDWSVPQKLSPVSLFFILGKILKESWLIILFLVGRYLFKTGDDNTADTNRSIYYFLGVTGTLLLIHIRHFIEFFRYRFFVEGNEFIVFSGVFAKVKTSVPINRIQSVHLIQTYLHQFTNTCELKLETAGSDKTEIALKAIYKDRALALQLLFNNKSIETTNKEEVQGVQIMGLKSMDLVKLAISENHIKTLLIIVGFAIARLDDLRQILGFDATSMIDEQVDRSTLGYTLLLQMFILIVFITLCVSFIRVIIRFANMHLNITQKGFQMQWGFLQTQQKMLIQSKVQLISWSSNFVRRLLGIQMFRFYMAGEDLVKTEQHIQLPVMESDTLRKLTEVYQSKWPKDKSPSFTLHHAFGWRSSLLYFLPIAIVASVGVYFWNPWYIFLPILIFIYLTISNWVRFKKFHFWMNNTTIQIQKGIWGEENILLNFNKIQQVSIKTSPFQRRKNLATIELYTAGETVTIPFIPKAQAQYIADWTLLCIEFKQQ